MVKRILAFPVFVFSVLVMTALWTVMTPLTLAAKAVSEVSKQLQEIVMPKEKEDER